MENPCSCVFQQIEDDTFIVCQIFSNEGDLLSTFSHSIEKPGCWYNVDTCEELAGPLHAFLTSRFRGWLHNKQYKEKIAPFQRLDS